MKFTTYNYIFILSIITFIATQKLHASSDSVKLIYEIKIQDEISPGMARMFSKAMRKASFIKADYILLHMNTYGGMLDAADSMRTAILNSKIPVTVFIDNNAASAGALISIACNKIYMRSTATFGAATVVNERAEALPDKYQSYMRAMMRATAEKRNRDPHIAEAMVDPRIYIAGVNDSGKVLTFTTSEAIKNNYCNGEAETITEVIKLEKIDNYKLQIHTPSFIDKMIGFLINPAVSGVLILIMLGGIYFEIQTPGLGMPLFAGIIAAILYFAPLYIEGLAANWEILLFALGVILIAVEIYFIPGVGVPAITGIIFVVAGLTLSMVGNNGFDFTFTSTDKILAALSIVITSMILSLILAFYLGNKLFKTNRFKKMVLSHSMNADDGYTIATTASSRLVGKSGITVSTLRPSGKVAIDGEVYTATANKGFIEANKEIFVIADKINLVVKEL